MKSFLYHLQINVSDASRSLPFYKDLFKFLGYKVIEQGDDYLGVGNGLTDFWIMETKKKYSKTNFHRKNTGINHLAFGVPDKKSVDTFYTNFLIKRGLTTLYNTPKAFPEYHKHYYSVFFEDPDRIKLEVVYRPGFKILMS
ncbi:MAG: VOC family protein [Patescibacteria group bacterium]